MAHNYKKPDLVNEDLDIVGLLQPLSFSVVVPVVPVVPSSLFASSVAAYMLDPWFVVRDSGALVALSLDSVDLCLVTGRLLLEELEIHLGLAVGVVQ
tara:strand:+ start:227 stop:517 length:291 start_codon:yes stop_codon:yes gene_type:complete